MIGSEEAVIASVMLDSRVLRAAVAECSPADFEDVRLGMIFRGMALMAGARESIDVISVSEHLLEWGVRGITAVELHTWITELPSATNVGTYAANVRKAALRRGLQEVAVRLGSEAGKLDPGVALANAQKQLVELRDGHEVRALRAPTLGEVLVADPADEYDWVVDELLERGDRLMLTGSEGGGKSTLVRQMAILAGAGLHPFTFMPMRKPARVLVVDAENSEKQWRREVRAMVTRAATFGQVNPAETVRVECIGRLDLTRDSDLGMLHRLVDELAPDVLFIGPLYRLTPRAINSDDDAAALLAALDTLRDRGLAMVIEAHAGHAVGAEKERDLRPRGSSQLLGWPEFGLGLRPAKDARSTDEFQLVRWRGGRDRKRRWPSRIARDASEWPWTPTAGF